MGKSSEMNIKMDYSQTNTGLRKVDQFCQWLIIKKNFGILAFEEGEVLSVPGAGFDPNFEYPFVNIPELKPLTSEFDRILIRTDGLSFIVYCVKSAFSGQGLTHVSLEALIEVGVECLSYTGKVQGNKMPVSFFLFELTDDINNKAQHLKDLKRFPGRKKVAVRSYCLNFASKETWNNIPLGGLFSEKSFYKKIMQDIENNQGAKSKDNIKIRSQVKTPLLTYGFIGLLTLIFAGELLVSGDIIGPTNGTLIALGGLIKEPTLGGEYYRLITAGFLHGSYVHLILNGIAFFISGMILEKLIGRAWLLSLFIMSVVGGSALSLMWNSPQTLSVGASGGIMGMLMTSFVVANRLPFSAEKTQILMHSMYMLIPALIPISMRKEGMNVDYAAHFGGAIVGLIISLFIYKSWSTKTGEPGFLVLAKALAVVCGGAALMAGSFVIYKMGVF